MKHIFISLLVVILNLLVSSSFAQNRAVSLHLSSTDNGIKGDVITKTIYVPEGYTPNYTYYSAMGWWGTHDEGDGYCGIQQHPNGRNYIFSLWDPESTNEPITANYQGHGTEVENFGGEGTGLKSWNFALGWETNTWYRVVTRIWDYNDHTFFGYWVQNMSSTEWYHLVTMDYPVPDVRINTGINSFLEDWYGNGAEVRRYHIKNGYKRTTEGEWVAFERCRFSVNQEAATSNYNNNYDGGVENEEYYYMQSGGTTEPTCGTTAMFDLAEDSLPQWDTIKLESLQARYDAIEKKVYLTWLTDTKTGPQLAYYGNIYDNAELTGEPVFSFSDTIPQRTKDTIDLSILIDGTYYLDFKVADIFDNNSNSLTEELIIDTEVKQPTAVFSVDTNKVLENSFISFTEYSLGVPSSWEWVFEGASPNTSTERNPKVAYSKAGVYNVQLIVSNTMGKDTLLKEDFITVEPSPDNAVDLRGTNGDFVNIPALNLTKAEFTFECWMKIEEDQQDYAGIFFSRDNTATGLNFRENNELGYHWNDLYYSWSSGLTVPLNEWCHVAWVVTQESCVLYLNGIPAFKNSKHNGIPFESTTKLGADNSFTRNFNGLLDEVRIWNVARTHDQILDYRHLDLDIESETYLIAYYKTNQENTEGLFDSKLNFHGDFENIDKDSWVSSFVKTNNLVKPATAFSSSTTEANIADNISFYDASAFVPTNWNWYFEKGTPSESSERFPIVSYTEAGTFEVKLVTSNTAGKDSIVKIDYILINTPPPPIAIFSASKTNIERGESISMNNLSKNDPTSFEWFFEGGTPEYSTSFAPEVLYETVGLFGIKLIVNNEYGADTLELDKYIKVTHPVGISENTKDITINQNNNELVIDMGSIKGASFNIYNVLGATVHSSQLNSGNNNLIISQKPGVYIVTIASNDFKTTKKIYISKLNF